MFDEDEKTVSGEQGRANVAKGGGPAGRLKKKKEPFVKCYTCGANGHKSNSCMVNKSTLSCTHCQMTLPQYCSLRKEGWRQSQAEVSCCISPQRKITVSSRRKKEPDSSCWCSKHKQCHSQAFTEQSQSQNSQNGCTEKNLQSKFIQRCKWQTQNYDGQNVCGQNWESPGRESTWRRSCGLIAER